MDAPPIQALEQGSELGGTEPDHTVLDLGPAKLSVLQPLGVEAQTRAVPEHELDAIGALGAKDKDRAAERIGAQLLTDQGRQALGAFPVMQSSA